MNNNIQVINNQNNIVNINKCDYNTGTGEISVISIDDSKLYDRFNESNFRLSSIESEVMTIRNTYGEYIQSENESLRKEIKELRRNLAYLNTRVNNLIAEKQLAKVNK